MTTVIDERVVEMRFNNADFEKNVAQSMSTLDSLKKSLNFDSAKSLEELGKASKGFSLAGITETITEATSKFSVLEIAGITAIAKITSAAMDMGTALVKSLSVDQVSMGFDKYAMKTQAVQTIIAATGEDIKTVTDEINKLNWFTDETSYNLVDMTNNIAKFTSNGVKLHDAVTQMMGIANAAALAGGNAESASHAMEGFSKAIAKGKMDRQNWKWIQTARMDTMQFKQSLIEAGVAAGTLTQVADGYFQTLQGHEVTLSNFEENMKDGWMTAQVMSTALEDYGNFAVKLNSTFEKLKKTQANLTTSELLDYIDEYKNGVLDIQKTADYLNISTEELESTMQELSDDALALGNKAFKAGQEAKTFKEAIDSVKDAVSTGWMNTFEYIFGNYEEAKKLWTGVANAMWDAFAAGGERRNEILKQWHELGGRNSLIMGAVNAANLLVKPLQAVSAAFHSMFPDINGMAELLVKATNKFKDFTEKIQPSEQTLKDIYFIFKGIFTIVKSVIGVFTSLVKAIFPITKPFGSLLEIVIHFLGIIGALIVKFDEFARQSGVLNVIISALGIVLEKVLNIIKMAALIIGGGIITALSILVNGILKAKDAIVKFVTTNSTLSNILNKIESTFRKVVEFFKSFGNNTEKVSTKIVKLKENLAGANKVIGQTGTLTKSANGQVAQSQTLLQKLLNILKGVGTVLAGVVLAVLNGVKTLGTNIFKFFTNLFNRFKEADKNSVTFFDHIKAVFVTIGGILKEIGDKISEFFEGIGIKTDKAKSAFEGLGTAISKFFKNLDGGKIAAIAMAAALLSLCGAAVKLADGFKSMLGSVTGVFNNINKILKKQFMKTSVITDLAKAFAILAGSLMLLSFVPQQDLKSTADVMLRMLVVFSACAAVLRGLDIILAKSMLSKKSSPIISSNILMLAAALGVLTGAMYILNETTLKGDWKEWIAKIAIIGALMTELVATSIIISKFSKTITKGSFLMLSIALAMKLIIDAVVSISKADINNAFENFKSLAVMFAGMSAVIAAAGGLKITSALALLLVVKVLQAVWPQLVSLVKLIGTINFSAIFMAAENNIKGAVVVLAGIAALIGAVWILGKAASGLAAFGAIFAGVGVMMYLITGALEKIVAIRNEISIEDLNEIMKIFGRFTVIVGAIMGAMMLFQTLSNVVGKKILKWTDNLAVNFFGVAAAFVGVGAAMLLIANAMKVVDSIPKDGLAGVTVAIGAVLGCLALVMASAGLIAKGRTVLTSLIGVVSALAVVIAEIAIVSIMFGSSIDAGTLPALIAAFAAVEIILISFAALLKTASKIKNSAAIIATLGPIMGSLLVIAGALIVLSESTSDLKKTAVAAISIIACLVVLEQVIKTISKSSGLGGTNAVNKMKVLLSLTALIAAVGASLAVVSIANSGKTLVALLSISALIGVMVLVLNQISSMKIGNNVMNKVLLLGAVSVSLLVLSASLSLLAQCKIPNTWSALGALSVGLGIMTGILALITMIMKNIKPEQLLGTIAALAGIALDIVSLAGAIALVSLIPTDKLWSAIGAMSVLMLAVTAMVTWLGVLSGLIGIIAGAFGGGAAGFFALPALLAAIGIAVIGLGAGLAMGSVGVLILSAALNVMVEVLKKYQDYDIDVMKIASDFGILAKAALALGGGMAVLGLGGLAGAIAIGALALALLAFNAVADKSIPKFKELSELDLVSIGLGLGAVALGALALSAVAPGILAAASAITVLGAAFQTLKEATDFLDGFFSDIAKKFSVSSGTIGKIASTFGSIMGMAVELGFRNGAQWHSPPKWLVAFMGDVGLTLTDNWHIVKAANTSGDQVGSAFSDGAVSALDEGIAAIKGRLGALSSLFGGVQFKIRGIVNKSGDEISKYGANGMPTDVINKMYGGSVIGGLTDSLKEMYGSITDVGEGLFSMDFIADGLTDTMGGLSDSFGGVGDAAEEAGGKVGKAGKSIKEFSDSIKDTIANQLDIFNKFEIKQGISANQMLENMKSNIDGFASWSHRLAVLAERGIDQALYQKLAEMGPKSLETVNAFVSMTDEQLQEANQLFATSMTLPQSQADIVTAGFTYAGEMAAKGFSTALDDHKQAHAAAQGLAKAAIEGVDETLQIHSPSKVMWQRGWYSQLGFRDGLRAGQPITINIIGMLCREIVEAFETGLGPEVFEQVGTTMLGNLFASILETSEEEPNPIITAMCEALTTFDLIDEAITLFVEHMKETFNTLFEMGEGGQSMWFYNFANFGIIQSMINALVANEVFLLTQLLMLGTGIMNTLRGPFGDEGKTLPQIAYDVGMNIALGLRDGINDYAEEAIAAARAMAEAVIAILESIPDINSPSKVTRKLGGFISQGYAIGIAEGAGNVYNAARDVANSAINGISSGRIQDALNSEFDFNPIITPILDLSYVREQLEELSSIMAIPVDATLSQNEGNNTSTSPSQINFTQNNYSPKALSRYEIYKDTKRQISQLKGVMG